MATPTQSQRPSVTYHVASTTDLASPPIPKHSFVLLFYFIIISGILSAFPPFILSLVMLPAMRHFTGARVDQLISHLSASRQENKALMWKKAAVDESERFRLAVVTRVPRCCFRIDGRSDLSV
ncbi:hypothetical protein AVEN_17596-1 [Araneus ventricosus]|uniref:Uncharacterized protein n=1 Tax=Araneus ventricosus TaxID=182803 RepID=A0A4Y2HVX2_ARAVE|nr:hypothetical protein AVEN_17596-1 [Araneus ventricosus]